MSKWHKWKSWTPGFSISVDHFSALRHVLREKGSAAPEAEASRDAPFYWGNLDHFRASSQG
jgi:hypothetical protein